VPRWQLDSTIRACTLLQVAQLAGYVAEHSAYHHGEASLQSTIVGLAQDFVGSNNVNLLFPSGQFGTRLQGGKDSASARYIFTRLALLARHLFNEDDDPLLAYQVEEGQRIEPEWCVFGYLLTCKGHSMFSPKDKFEGLEPWILFQGMCSGR
jgi:hypothetical protein